ncbi:hypothetical protein BDD12DRAFT_832211 [Trichophaea hybrida]|nr:hypothetical protein BDD12DRAFT_832211 [Trichophaea hybrida]
MRLFTPLILALCLFITASCADSYHTDLLKRRAPPPPRALSKRTPALKTGTAGYGCDNGYEQCPGFNYCCQAGLTCFSDGTCGTIDQLTCMTGETACGEFIPLGKGGGGSANGMD